LLLDGTSKALAKSPPAVGKSSLVCLVGLTNVQLIELGNKLFKKKVTFQNRLVQGGNLHIKTMVEWCNA
jgi:hypothetical protein